MLNTDEINKINTLYKEIDTKDAEIAHLRGELDYCKACIDVKLNQIIDGLHGNSKPAKATK